MSRGVPVVLNVVNYPLPAGDYRVQYARRSSEVRMMFALPRRPEGVAADDVVVLPFGEGVHWRDLVTFVRLARVLRRLRRSLAFVHFYSTKLILLGPLVAALVGVRSVVTVTGFGRLFVEERLVYRWARYVYRLLFGVAIRLSDGVLFQNHADMEATVATFPSCAAKAKYVGSATADVVAADRSGRNDVLRVVHVARLLPSKGIEDFVAVADHLRDEPIEFVLVGGRSDDYPDMAALVREAARRGALDYRGRLESVELDAVYRVCDVVFFPSYGEGMARVMLEAGMHGLCPVAYDIPANRDLISSGRGFLLPLRDVAGAAELLRSLARKPEEVARNARAFQAHVRAEFGMDSFAARLDGVIRELTPTAPLGGAR